MSFSTRFCFTINSYTDDDIEKVEELALLPNCNYLIYGKEVGENGNLHLQGFFILKSPQRYSWCSRRLSRAHIEAAKGTSLQASNYCKKEGDFKEFGTFPNSQGKRTDLDRFFHWSDEFILEHGRAPSFAEVSVHQPNICAKFPRILNVVRARAPHPILQQGEPNDWQQVLEARLNQEADDRKVLFYVDEDGGRGKTWFQRYYFTKYPGRAQLLTFGKRDDTAYLVEEETKVFFFNIPKTAMEHLNFHILEQLKDRVIQSNKYESRVKILASNVHVVVFSNEFPPSNKMSEDRYEIVEF